MEKEQKLIEVLNRIIYAAGAPLGSDNYFEIRGLCSPHLNEEHWTAKHIKAVEKGEQFVAYDEAGLEHSRHKTYDEARDALVVYAATQLREARPHPRIFDTLWFAREFVAHGKCHDFPQTAGTHINGLTNVLEVFATHHKHWRYMQLVVDDPFVHETIQNFADDPNNDNAVCTAQKIVEVYVNGPKTESAVQNERTEHTGNPADDSQSN